MPKAKYLKNKAGSIFVRTPELEKVEGMVPCDQHGKMVDETKTAPPAPPAKPPVEPVATGQAAGLTLDDYRLALEAMDREELKTKADELAVVFPANIGDEKLREKILAAVEVRLASDAVE